MKKATLTLAAASALLFAGGIVTSTFGGPERIESKDKMVMAPPPVCDPRWYFSVGGSLDRDLGSEFSDGNHDSFAFAGLLVDADVKGRDYDDVYNNWYNIRGEVGYVLTNHIELFAKFEYTRADSEIIAGPHNTVFFSGQTLPHDLDLVSRWSDYESYGGEIGLRYFFTGKEAKWRPNISVSGGATWVDDIGLRVDSELFGDNFTVYNGPFYDGTIVPTVSALIGVEYNITCHISVGSDIGVKWTGELDQNDSHFDTSIEASTAISTSPEFSREAFATRDILSHTNNNGGSRLSFPYTVYMKVRF